MRKVFYAALTVLTQHHGLRRLSSLLHPLWLLDDIERHRTAQQGMVSCAAAQQLSEEPRIMH